MREGETILDRLAEHARERVRAARMQIPPEEIRRQARYRISKRYKTLKENLRRLKVRIM